MDFTAKYNTALSPQEEAQFIDWATKEGRLEDLYDYDMRGFFQNKEAFARNGHGTDRYKKPNHPTFSDQSLYHGVDGYLGGSWTLDPQGADVYTAPAKHVWSEPELQEYFAKYEPGVKLVYPQATPLEKITNFINTIGQ